METHKTYCRNCGAACAMELTVEAGKITYVAPDGSASPFGAYMCPKGKAAADFHNGAEERLIHHQKRQPDGSFKQIDSESTLSEISAKLKDLIDTYGPRSVAVYHGTGAYRSILGGLLEKGFLSAIGSPNLFSTMTIDQSAKWITSGRLGMMASGKPHLYDIDLAVIAGNNPLVSHQTWPFAAGVSGAPGRAYVEFKKQGGKMIMIDPRRNETARFADLLIQPLPGHDAAIFASIAYVLLRDGTYNQDFCGRFVSQIDELKTAVAGFTPEFAAARAGITPQEIELAAKIIGEAKRPFVGSGSGPSMSAHSNLNDHMIETVNALVGGYRRAGDRVRNPGTLNPKAAYEMAVAPTRSWEKGVKAHSADIGKLWGEFPTALLPDEITTPGDNKIRAVINFGGNLIMGLGDPDRAIEAFSELDLFVSLDARMNETCELSDYVIATTQPFERHDISVSADGQYPEPFAQYAAPVLPKPGDTIHDWEFFWEMGARLGHVLKLKFWTYGLDYDTIPEAMDLSTDTPPDGEEMCRFLTHKARISFDDLKANPGGVRPEIAPEYVQPAPKDNGQRLELCPDDVAAELAAVLSEEPETDFSYQIICRRILEAMNSAYRNADRTQAKYPENWAYMNPDDMTDEGLSDGDDIRIASEHGWIMGKAKAEDRLRRGVISMTHMFGGLKLTGASHRGAFTGRLTSLDKYLEPINFMPRFSGIPVNIEKEA